MESIKKLGFGLMRLPQNGDKIDIEQTKIMVDEFLEKGFTYFDTAYVYGENGASEKASKAALVDRYPREKYQLASKLPIWCCETKDDLQKVFDTSLTRCGVEYFDFYLNHSLSKDKLDKLDELGAWDFVTEMKNQGKVKHMGFSFHDSAEVLDEILTKHPEQEFVQLQINYHDWENDDVQSRKCYEVARKHGKPIIIMEPVRGGALAELTEEIQGIFKSVRPDMSVASWALRFCANLEGVITVLSGMSNTEQMRDNLSFMAELEPFSDEEAATVKKVADILANTPTIPCTSCKYCTEGCPVNINIPEFFKVFNRRTVYGAKEQTQKRFNEIAKDGGSPADCISCGQCENVCPQHINIIEQLKAVSKEF